MDRGFQLGCIGRRGKLYYQSPVAKDFAFSRNALNPDAFSVMGVTFTLSSNVAMFQLADLVLPPFKPCVQRADPFARFEHFPSHTLTGNAMVLARPSAQARLADLLSLAMANYAFGASLLPRETIVALLSVLERNRNQTVNELLVAAGVATPVGVRCLMWLWKFDLLQVVPAPSAD